MKSILLILAAMLPALPVVADDHSPDASSTTTDFANSGKSAHPLLIDEMNKEIDRRTAAAGSDPGDALNIFSSADDDAFTYVRSKTSWVHDLDLTGVVITHDYICQTNHLTSGGALITPQDVVCAAHFGISEGAVLNFVDSNNVIHTGKVVKGAPVPNTDIDICHLLAPVTGVKSYKVLPPDYAHYDPDRSLTRWPVLLAYNFGHRAYLLDCYRLYAELGFFPCSEPSRVKYTTHISSGSGSPAFTVINGEPILVGCLHTTGSTSWLASNEPGINAVLAALGSTYTVTPVNLASPVAYARF